ncbi:hypothetical protein WA1_00845 [Scytonema hofmannii PCC 7110]|uniref:Enediyne biosynthesis protein n=2 Tax=Scytonema hofmannii TaxID=34078 RepID=A0A139XGB9_9CYAN|nr:hypothetical protein WA1_00845 [Scytonema hofmannii PCC 7110]
MFGIPLVEATCATRGFQGSEIKVQQRFEQIGHTFLHGYHTALEDDKPESLVFRLNTIEAELRGFAFEGAAMGLTLLDKVIPLPRSRLQIFLESAGSDHAYMVHVGVGWLLARLHQRVEPFLAKLDPLLCWLVVDGYGFHEGYFHWRDYIQQQKSLKQLSSYARRVFDQGLGRSLWFVNGADVTLIPATIAAFPLARHSDLWSGIGLACTYAGGVERDAIEALQIAAKPYQPYLAQGAAFAAKARQRASNPAAHTELACQVFCNMSADAAARVTDMALEKLPTNGAEPAYEIWRQRVQTHFTSALLTAL